MLEYLLLTVIICLLALFFPYIVVATVAIGMFIFAILMFCLAGLIAIIESIGRLFKWK